MTCFHPCYNSTRVKSLMPGMDLSPCKKGLHSSQEETETGFCLFSSSLFISHQGELIEHKEFLIWVTCHSSSSGWGCSISSFVWHSQTHLVQPGQASAELGLTLMALCVWQTLQRGEHKYRLTLGFLLNPFGDWGGGSGSPGSKPGCSSTAAMNNGAMAFRFQGVIGWRGFDCCVLQNSTDCAGLLPKNYSYFPGIKAMDTKVLLYIFIYTSFYYIYLYNNFMAILCCRRVCLAFL